MSYDFSKITERLWIGAQINGQADVAEIAAAGITHVIDAQAERDDSLYENFRAANISYLWDGTADDQVHPKPVDWFRNALNFALPGMLLTPSAKILTHCAAGVNRGPSLGYAILRALGLDATTVRAMIITARLQTRGGIAYAGDAELALVTLGYQAAPEAG